MAENNQNDTDKLIKWKEEYSSIKNITGNNFLGETNSEATKALLYGSAAGTKDKSYLDPVPFKNLLEKIYTNIIEKISGASARADSLKMNRDNMDYTLYDPEKDTISEEKNGLNLLMPQYQRRVEVEDLDENFWVISLALDAVLKALWGPYGLIEIVRELIGRFRGVEKFLGLNNITDIELLYEGNNDLYFDMFSRFNLYSLAIKLKTGSGERVIKNIISKTDDTYYRKGESFAASSREELFKKLQKEISKDNKLYDSELISSELGIYSDQKKFILLSSVIDAINGKIENGDEEFKPLEYNNYGTELKTFLGLVDEAAEVNLQLSGETTGKITTQESNAIASDSIMDFSKKIISYEELKKILKYEKAYKYFCDNQSAIEGQLADINLEVTELGELFKTETTFIEIPIKDMAKLVESIGEDDETKQFLIDKGNNELEIIKNTFKMLENLTSKKPSVSQFSNRQEHEGINRLRDLVNMLAQLKTVYSYESTNAGITYYVYQGETLEDGSSKKTLYVTSDSNDKNGEKMFTVTIPTQFDDIKNILSSGDNEDIEEKAIEKNYRATLQYNILASRWQIIKDDSDSKDSDIKYLLDKRDRVNQFFNVNNNNGFTLQDCIDIAKNMLGDGTNQEYINKIGADYLNEEKLFEDKDKVLFFLHLLRGLNSAYNISSENNTLIKTMKKYENSTSEITDADKNIIINGLHSILSPTINTENIVFEKANFVRPTLQLSILLDKIKKNQKDSSTEGWYITLEDTSRVLETIKKTEYGLFGNIVLFLYDKDYYEYVIDTNEQGLKIKGKDGYFLQRENLTDKMIPLFIGREDLINGEILQLRLTQKDRSLNNFGDDGVKPYQVNFEKLINNINNNKSEDYVTKEIHPEIFLSLHNSFAGNVGQYNFRTSLFFKDTTPFLVNDPILQPNSSSDQDSMPKNLDDWFRNGIVCTYFKPTEITNSDGTTTITTNFINRSLKIRASMIAKNEPYIDNSFVFETITGPIKNNDSTGYQAEYSFEKKCAYFAAMRHNLIFYSSPPQNEYGQFIHSPSKLLLSPNIKPSDDTIQTTRLSTTKPENLKDTDTWKCEDVFPGTMSTGDLSQIKDALYRNAYEKYPLQIEAIFGRRDVDNYIKKKELRYVVIDREKGIRHKTYGPTEIEVTGCTGYLHSKKNLTCNLKINRNEGGILWYGKNDKDSIDKIANSDNIIGNSPSEKSLYGVFRVSKFIKNYYLDTFMIRFYSSNGTQSKDAFDIPSTDSNYSEPNRRPIFSMAYFFGIDEDNNLEEK